MSVSSVSPNPYSYLQWPQTAGVEDTDQSPPPSDPLQALYQAFSGDPLANPSPDDGSASAPSCPFSLDVMQALFSAQANPTQSGSSAPSSLISKFDTDGDGQISQSEFESAIGSGADQSKVDALFAKIDANGDGEISTDEMQSAMQKAQAGHHHHHHHASGTGGGDPLQALLSGASADGTTSQTTTNSDGSTTTTLTYADGTKIDMTTPAASDASANANASSSDAMTFASLLKQLISLQAQLAPPTTNFSV